VRANGDSASKIERRLALSKQRGPGGRIYGTEIANFGALAIALTSIKLYHTTNRNERIGLADSIGMAKLQRETNVLKSKGIRNLTSLTF
jgi:hypothetical protein